MKHAYLILAHNEYPVLDVLLSMLDDVRNDVYVHVDAKNEHLYKQVCSFPMRKAGFFVLENRIKVYWGHFSQIQAELALLTAAFDSDSYDYYHFLSGVDLPIKSQDEINRFFEGHSGKEFVGFWSGEMHERDIKRKVGRYHVFLRFKRKKHHLFHPITSFLYNILLAGQDLFGCKRNKSFGEFKKGFTWCSLSRKFVAYLIKRKEEILHRFRYTLCGDEIFIHTLLWNSSFRDRIYNIDDAECGSLRKVDFSRGNHGHPYVWGMSDLEDLKSSNLLFARKFSSSDMQVVKAIQNLYGVFVK